MSKSSNLRSLQNPLRYLALVVLPTWRRLVVRLFESRVVLQDLQGLNFFALPGTSYTDYSHVVARPPGSPTGGSSSIDFR